MSWADTNEPVTDDAVHQWLMQAEQVHNDGSSVLEGCEVTPGGALTVDVAAGVVFVNGGSQTVTALNVSVATEQGLLGTGEANFVGFYIDTAGAIQKVSGTADTGGLHIPPALLNRTSVPIALVTIADGDGTVDAGDIAEWRIHSSQGAGFTGDVYHWRSAIPEVGTPLEPSRESRWYASRYNGGSPTLEYMRARTVITSDAANQLFWELLDSAGQWRIRVRGNTTELHFNNEAGPDPILIASNSTRILRLTGGFRPTDNLEWQSGTGFVADLDHAITENRTYSFPDANITMAGLEIAQTFTAIQTFRAAVDIQDSADSDESVFYFDPTARTLRIGASDGNDNIAISAYGTLDSVDISRIILFKAAQVIDVDETGAPNEAGTTMAFGSVVIPIGPNINEYFVFNLPQGAIITEARARVKGGAAGSDLQLRMWSFGDSPGLEGTTNALTNIGTSWGWQDCYATGLPLTLADTEVFAVELEVSSVDGNVEVSAFEITYTETL